MTRLSNEQLEKVKERYNVSQLYSWSRINCFMTSHYEFFLKYVLHKKEDIDNCAYAPMGGITHTTLEKFYTGKIDYDEMYNSFDDGWTVGIDVADLKFDRNDEEKNEKIKTKYKADLTHFFKHHNPIEHKVAIEKFVTAKIGSFVLQGYIDAAYKDDNGNYNIIDWKTSSAYRGKTLEEKSGQLCVYSLGLVQAGVPLEKIKAGFNFLKYCTVQYEQANGDIKTRDIERYKIGESLKSNVKMWLKKLGYEDDLDKYIDLLISTNSIDCLPDEVQDKYVFSDCYVYIPLNQKLIDKWVKVIDTTIKDILMRESDYEKTKNDACFWDDEDSVKKESYYYATLCGYSPNLLKPYAAYLEKLERAKNGGNIFDGVGSEFGSNAVQTYDNKEVDLSWLDSL